MHDCLAVNAELANPYWFYPGVLVHRQTCRHAQPTPTQPAIFPCGDDRWVYFVLITAEQKAWHTLLDWMDSKGLAVDLLDPEYDDPGLPPSEFRAHPGDRGGRSSCCRRPTRPITRARRGACRSASLNAPEDLLDDEHLRARDFFVSVDHDDWAAGAVPGCALPLLGPGARRLRRAPKLGEHTGEILGPLSAGASSAPASGGSD